MVMKNFKESFDWVRLENIDPSLKKEFLVKIVAKTPSKTDHTKDMTVPKADRVIRIYPKEELEIAARSLAMRHIDFNHDMKRVIPQAAVLDAEWFDERVEALLYIPDMKIINKLKNGEFEGFSVEEMIRTEEKTPEGMIQRGMTYTGLAIVELPFHPGDPNAKEVEFFETTNGVKFEALLEVKVIGEPFADYTDFADCVSKNQDKDNPEAYCGSIQAQTEGKTLEECKEIIGKIPFILKKVESKVEEPKKEEPKPEEVKKVEPNPVEVKIKDLEAAILRLQEQVKGSDKKLKEEVAEAKKEGKMEVLEKINKVIPSVLIQRQGSFSFNRLAQDVKRVIREESGDNDKAS